MPVPATPDRVVLASAPAGRVRGQRPRRCRQGKEIRSGVERIVIGSLSAGPGGRWCSLSEDSSAPRQARLSQNAPILSRRARRESAVPVQKAPWCLVRSQPDLRAELPDSNAVLRVDDGVENVPLSGRTRAAYLRSSCRVILRIMTSRGTPLAAACFGGAGALARGTRSSISSCLPRCQQCPPHNECDLTLTLARHAGGSDERSPFRNPRSPWPRQPRLRDRARDVREHRAAQWSRSGLRPLCDLPLAEPATADDRTCRLSRGHLRKFWVTLVPL